MTRDFFDAQLGRLIVLRGWPDHADEHFAALRDIPADVFTAAVDHALKTRTWFPVPAELRADADVVARVRRPHPIEPDEPAPVGDVVEYVIANPFGGKGITVRVDREWRHECERCQDTGMASRWCGAVSSRFPDMPLAPCGRRNAHAAHDWVETCVCVEWNRTIKRRREALLTSYAQPAAKTA